MLEVLRQGGLGQGGLNFDCKVRRESTELDDMFIAHISAMDAFALGLKKAAKIIEDGVLSKLLAARYSTFDSGIGALVEQGKASFEELAEYVHKRQADGLHTNSTSSGKQERFEQLLNHYLYQ